MQIIGFNGLQTIDELCDVLNISRRKLNYLLYVKKNKYNRFTIPKKNGGERVIFSPSSDLKWVQNRVKEILENTYKFPSCVHAFTKNKSCYTNALHHISKRYVLNFDIKDFFPSIHIGRIIGLFQHEPFNCSYSVSVVLAQLVCCNNFLPQGSPCSPIISNIICYTLDRELTKLCRRNRCKYSRYADDISISTNSEIFPKEIAIKSSGMINLSEKVINIISGGHKNGFQINSSKLSLSKWMQHQEVTGIVVNKKTNLKKKYIKQIRAIFYEIRKNGFISASFKTLGINYTDEQKAREKMRNYILGKLNYYKMIKGENDFLFLKYAMEFNDIFKCDVFDIEKIQSVLDYCKDRCLIISDSDNMLTQGTAFKLNNGYVYTSTHVLLNNDTFKNIIYNKDQDGYDEQFPFSTMSNDFPYIYLYDRDEKFKKFIGLLDITKSDFESDVFCFKSDVEVKTFKLSKKATKIGDEVFMLGYPSYEKGKTSISYIETKIDSQRTFFDKTYFHTLNSPRPGMSGGPVLNSNKEIIGIVFSGHYEEDKLDELSGFIPLVH